MQQGGWRISDAIKAVRMWASIYPGQKKLRWAGIFPTAAECWEDCEWASGHMSATRAELKAAGYRVIRIQAAVERAAGGGDE